MVWWVLFEYSSFGHFPKALFIRALVITLDMFCDFFGAGEIRSVLVEAAAGMSGRAGNIHLR